MRRDDHVLGRRAATRALLGGRDVHELPADQVARRRAVMPQDTAVAFPFTTREVVAMGRTPWREGRRRSDAVVDEVMELTGLAPLADREITTLSGGKRQLASFARVIAQATPVEAGSVILLDEPTAAMDIGHAESTLTLVRTLAARGAAVGVVLHDIDAAAAYADRMVLMDGGGIRAIGATRHVCVDSVLSQVYGTPIDVFERDGAIHVRPVRTVPQF